MSCTLTINSPVQSRRYGSGKSNRPKVLKVAFVGWWQPGAGGGPTRYFSELIAELGGTALIGVLNPRRRTAGRPKLIQAAAIMRDVLFNGCSIVHVTTFGFHILLLPLLYYFTEKRLVVTVHGLLKTSPEYGAELGKWRRRSRRFLEELELRCSDITLFPSEMFLQRALEVGYRPRRYQVIPHGVRMRGGDGCSQKASETKQYVIIGGLLLEKGVLRIPTILSALGANETLLWVGYDPNSPAQRKNWEAIVRCRFDSRFTVSLTESPERIQQWLMKASALLIPSTFETFSMTALEACAAGVPVVLSDTVGVSEVLSRHGCSLTADFDRSCSIRAALDTIAADHDGFSRRARSAAESLDWAQAAAAHLSVYREETKTTPRRTPVVHPAGHLGGLVMRVLRRRDI